MLRAQIEAWRLPMDFSRLTTKARAFVQDRQRLTAAALFAAVLAGTLATSTATDTPTPAAESKETEKAGS
jgi:hypothetical protein